MAQVTIVFDSNDESLADVVGQITMGITTIERDDGSYSITTAPRQLDLPMEDHKIPIRDSEWVDELPPIKGSPASDLDKSLQDFIGTEVDADNVPWDDRIHSGSKATTAKGVWKKRKGVDADEHARITAELQALEVTGTLAPPDEHHAPAAPAPAAPAAPAPAAPAAPAPAAPAATSAWTWPKMIKAITGGMRDKQFDAAAVNAVLADHGIEELALLSPHVDKFDSVATALNLVLPE